MIADRRAQRGVVGVVDDENRRLRRRAAGGAPTASWLVPRHVGSATRANLHQAPPPAISRRAVSGRSRSTADSPSSRRWLRSGRPLGTSHRSSRSRLTPRTHDRSSGSTSRTSPAGSVFGRTSQRSSPAPLSSTRTYGLTLVVASARLPTSWRRRSSARSSSSGRPPATRGPGGMRFGRNIQYASPRAWRMARRSGWSGSDSCSAAGAMAVGLGVSNRAARPMPSRRRLTLGGRP